MPLLDCFVNAWLDAMVKAGFTAARWWTEIVIGRGL